MMLSEKYLNIFKTMQNVKNKILIIVKVYMLKLIEWEKIQDLYILSQFLLFMW